MNLKSTYNFISTELIKWYETNKRELPWREISDPYKIWISEIILQQTRVNQGLNYYTRFIEHFPTVEMLASANEDKVLKYWQGLGYYTRARNLHKAAKQILNDFNGIFPTEYNSIIRLAGIGEYTAAAISSFAFNNHYAVVDGNVYRVLSRLFNIQTPINSISGKKEFTILAQDLIPKAHPAIHNQAIMEFGALQCIPSSPDCSICPLHFICKAFINKSVSLLPVKIQKKKSTYRFFNYLFIRDEEKTFLQRRVLNDVWKNLFEFPLIETDHLLSAHELIENENFKSMFNDVTEIGIDKISNPMKHILSHRVIVAQFIFIKASENFLLKNEFITVPLNEIDEYAVSRLMELFLENYL